MPAFKFTTDHQEIRRWAEHRGGVPATIRGSASEDGPGILRIALPASSKRANLQALTWDEFFAAVEADELAFMYDERGCGLVGRHGACPGTHGRRAPARMRTRRRVGAITLLERQHRELEAMFQRFQGLEDDYAAKESAFTRIADALAAHARIEEMIFYPAMFGVETGFELVDAVEDHVEVKRVLTDLLGMRVTDARFDAKMDALEQLVWRHVVEEEEDLFDMVEALDREARLELGTRMQRAYEQLLQTEPRFEVPDEIDYAAPVA